MGTETAANTRDTIPDYRQYSRATSMMMSNYHQQPIYSTSDTFNSMITTSYSYSNFTTSDSADSLPVISGDIMLPGPISSSGELSSANTLVEGGSTISNLSVLSQPGSVEHLSPIHNMANSQDDLNANNSLVG